MTKDTERFLKWDAKMERRYGLPLMRYLAEQDEDVMPSYFEWRDHRCNASHLNALSNIILLIACAILIFGVIESWDIDKTLMGAIIFLILSYSLSTNAKVEKAHCDITMQRIVACASREAKEKTVRKIQEAQNA